MEVIGKFSNSMIIKKPKPTKTLFNVGIVLCFIHQFATII